MLGLEDIDILELFDGNPLDDARVDKFVNRIVDMTYRITSDAKNGERANAIANEGFVALTSFLDKDMKC